MFVYALALLVSIAVCAYTLSWKKGCSNGVGRTDASVPAASSATHTVWLAVGTMAVVLLHLGFLFWLFLGWGQSDDFNKPPFGELVLFPYTFVPELVLLLGGGVAVVAARRRWADFYVVWAAAAAVAFLGVIVELAVIH